MKRIFDPSTDILFSIHFYERNDGKWLFVSEETHAFGVDARMRFFQAASSLENASSDAKIILFKRDKSIASIRVNALV
jgi:hypothetical protein